MSYLMTHLIIADEYFDNWYGKSNPQADRTAFILGALSPDAVHMRKNYTPFFKERSHVIPEGIRWGHVRTKEQIEAWRYNITDFHKNFVCSGKYNGRELDFYMGYVVHLLTDDYNCLKIFGPAISASGLGFDEFMAGYRQDAIRMDDYLYHSYGRSREIFDGLVKAEAFDVEGNVSAEEIHRMVLFYDEHFKTSEYKEIDDQKIFTKAVNDEFIKTAGAWIYGALLTAGGNGQFRCSL